MRRPGAPAFIAWGAVPGRGVELAAEIDADVLSCFPPGPGRRPAAPLRYLLSAIRTAFYLLRRRPRAVVVTNPPIIPGLIAAAYCWLSGSALVLDDHPGAFGAMGYRPGRWLAPVHRIVVRRARLCLVTEETWSSAVEAWGGRAVVLHEAPGDMRPVPYRTPGQHPTVLFVCTFGRDEPVAAVFDAARLLPEVNFVVTGDPSRRPAMDLPSNVELVGFLPSVEYRSLLDAADVVLALTTEPTSAMRAAFEAVWCGKVLVISDWPLGRQLFPAAIHVPNTGEGVKSGIDRALAEHTCIQKLVLGMREVQLERWTAQRSALRAAVGTE